VEPRADGVIHGGLRIVHCSDRGKVGAHPAERSR
jgi:hypothetical protein